jgi:hypothetical protein
LDAAEAACKRKQLPLASTGSKHLADLEEKAAITCVFERMLPGDYDVALSVNHGGRPRRTLEAALAAR